MGPIPVVFDTNVLVSALGFGGTPLAALLRTFKDDMQLLASDASMDELDRVMQYERLPFTDEDRVGYITILSREITLIEPETTVPQIERDPDDTKFLECASAGNARYLVSGDDHLLALGSFQRTKIVTPDGFLQELDKYPPSTDD